MIAILIVIGLTAASASASPEAAILAFRDALQNDNIEAAEAVFSQQREEER